MNDPTTIEKKIKLLSTQFPPEDIADALECSLEKVNQVLGKKQGKTKKHEKEQKEVIILPTRKTLQSQNKRIDDMEKNFLEFKVYVDDFIRKYEKDTKKLKEATNQFLNTVGDIKKLKTTISNKVNATVKEELEKTRATLEGEVNTKFEEINKLYKDVVKKLEKSELDLQSAINEYGLAKEIYNVGLKNVIDQLKLLKKSGRFSSIKAKSTDEKNLSRKAIILELNSKGMAPKEIMKETGYQYQYVYDVLSREGRLKKQKN